MNESRTTDFWQCCCGRIQQRWVLATMGSLAFATVFTMRVCVIMAMTEMVVPHSSPLLNFTKYDEACPGSGMTSLTSAGSGTYEWDEYTQGIILSSFYWGFILPQVPSGILSERIGGKYVVGFGVFLTSIFTLITPLVVQTYDSTGLIVLRILSGVSEGAIYPSINVLVAQWAPPNERSKLASTAMSGIHVGTLLGTALSGVIIQQSPIGWPMAFYVFGSFGILWFFAWVILCYNNPGVHPFISENEKKHLHDTMQEHTHRKIPPTPYRHILSSTPFWAVIVAASGHTWGFNLLVNNLPKYMSNVLKFSIQMNGMLTALPNFCMWFVSALSSWFADWLIKSDRISRKNVRKIFYTIAMMGSSIIALGASYAGCDQTLAVILFTISMTMMSLCYASVLVNPLDLSPNYAGTIKSVMMLASALTGSLVPYTIGILAPNQGLLEWRIVFWITLGFLSIVTLMFNICADGEVQYWNNLDPRIEEQKEIELKERHPFLDRPIHTVIMPSKHADPSKN